MCTHRERGRERGETERERERERERCRICPELLFFKRMAGALAPFSYLVLNISGFKFKNTKPKFFTISSKLGGIGENKIVDHQIERF